jgi:hypothetical protein
MVAMGIFLCKGKIPTAEPGVEPGTSWLVFRSSDHQATRLVELRYFIYVFLVKALHVVWR